MSVIDGALAEFFREYEARIGQVLAGNLDVEAMADAFAACFIRAEPRHIAGEPNEEQLRTVIVQRIAFCRSTGAKSLAIVSVATTALDTYQYRAKVRWRARYEQRDSTEGIIDFTDIYLLRAVGSKPKIFGSITGDVRQLYREQGLVTA